MSSYEIFVIFVIHCQSPPNFATTREWSFSQSATLNIHQVLLNALPVYQNMINMNVGFPFWRCPSVFMGAVMWEHYF
jgi:hypothetical protein